ncbi:hypothetical protein HK405_000263 [Cladochytrium tenue]|nr:hypothetical protein HK405_000263 [Cladochytrium tenue]
MGADDPCRRRQPVLLLRRAPPTLDALLAAAVAALALLALSALISINVSASPWAATEVVPFALYSSAPASVALPAAQLRVASALTHIREARRLRTSRTAVKTTFARVSLALSALRNRGRAQKLGRRPWTDQFYGQQSQTTPPLPVRSAEETVDMNGNIATQKALDHRVVSSTNSVSDDDSALIQIPDTISSHHLFRRNNPSVQSADDDEGTEMQEMDGRQAASAGGNESPLTPPAPLPVANIPHTDLNTPVVKNVEKNAGGSTAASTSGGSTAAAMGFTQNSGRRNSDGPSLESWDGGSSSGGSRKTPQRQNTAPVGGGMSSSSVAAAQQQAPAGRKSPARQNSAPVASGSNGGAAVAADLGFTPLPGRQTSGGSMETWGNVGGGGSKGSTSAAARKNAEAPSGSLAADIGFSPMSGRQNSADQSMESWGGGGRKGSVGIDPAAVNNRKGRRQRVYPELNKVAAAGSSNAGGGLVPNPGGAPAGAPLSGGGLPAPVTAANKTPGIMGRMGSTVAGGLRTAGSGIVNAPGSMYRHSGLNTIGSGHYINEAGNKVRKHATGPAAGYAMYLGATTAQAAATERWPVLASAAPNVAMRFGAGLAYTVGHTGADQIVNHPKEGMKEFTQKSIKMARVVAPAAAFARLAYVGAGDSTAGQYAAAAFGFPVGTGTASVAEHYAEHGTMKGYDYKGRAATFATNAGVNALSNYIGGVAYQNEHSLVAAVAAGNSIGPVLSTGADMTGDMPAANIQRANKNKNGAGATREVQGGNKPGAAAGGANKRGASTGGANKRGANKSGANNGGANKRGANKRGANSSGANKRGANKRGANSGGANKRGANKRGANNGGANKRGANKRGANRVGANKRGGAAGNTRNARARGRGGATRSRGGTRARGRGAGANKSGSGANKGNKRGAANQGTNRAVAGNKRNNNNRGGANKGTNNRGGGGANKRAAGGGGGGTQARGRANTGGGNKTQQGGGGRRSNGGGGAGGANKRGGGGGGGQARQAQARQAQPQARQTHPQARQTQPQRQQQHAAPAAVQHQQAAAPKKAAASTPKKKKLRAEWVSERVAGAE